MRLLLDTHAYLWWLRDDSKLSSGARQAIASPASLVHVSAATIWEAAIKAEVGRLQIDGDLVEEIENNNFIELPMTAAHAALAGALPPHHRDPFDRMLVAQAGKEALQLVTHDSQLADYGVQILAT